MRVVAIDPGFERVGIAVLERAGGKEGLLYSSCFRTSAKLSFSLRLKLIAEEIVRILETYHPEALAIETLFFSNNQKTAMRVAEARGAIVCACALAGIPVHEYTPLQVKTAVAGYGKADKRQVALMVSRLLGTPAMSRSDDETDAIAVGLTCLASERPARISRRA